MRDFLFWTLLLIMVAIASMEAGYIIAKKEDVWHDEGQYLNLKTRIHILEREIFKPDIQPKKGRK